VDQLERVLVACLDDEPLQRLAESLGQLADRALGVRRRQRLEVRGRHRLSHEQERRADPEGAGLVEHEPDGQERRGGAAAALAVRAEQETRRSGAQRQQGRLALALPFGKNQERLIPPERVPGGAEHGPVVH